MEMHVNLMVVPFGVYLANRRVNVFVVVVAAVFQLVLITLVMYSVVCV